MHEPDHKLIDMISISYYESYLLGGYSRDIGQDYLSSSLEASTPSELVHWIHYKATGSKNKKSKKGDNNSNIG